jgi:hypothetical protein
VCFFSFKNFVNQISHNSIYAEKDAESWIYFSHFLGIRYWLPSQRATQEEIIKTLLFSLPIPNGRRLRL